MGHDVFISHSSKDKAAADAVCAALEASGIACWIAPRNVRPGKTYAAELIQAINDSKVLVLLHSTASNESQQVHKEVERADAKHIAVISVRIETCQLSHDLEYFLSSVQWIDATKPPLNAHLEALADAVRGLLAERGGPAPAPVSMSPKTSANPNQSRSKAIALTLIILVLAGIGAWWSARSKAPAAVMAAAEESAAKHGIPVTGHPPPKTSNPEAAAAYASALQSFRDGSLAESYKELRHAVSLDPSLAAAHLRLSLYPTLGELPSSARASFVAASQFRANLDDRDTALLPVADAWTAEPQDKVEVLRRVRAVAGQFPDDAEIAFNLVVALERAGDLLEARKVTEHALELDPQFAAILWLVAGSYWRENDIADTAATYERCIRISSMAASCVRNLAVLHDFDGRCSDVEADARRMLSIEPDGATSHWWMGRALAAEGKPVESVHAALDEATALGGTAYGVFPAQAVEDASYTLLTGNLSGAENAGRALVKGIAGTADEKDHGLAVAWLITIAEEQGDPKRALSLAEDFEKQAPAWKANDPGGVRLWRLYLLHEAGQLDDASFQEQRNHLYEEGLKLEPANPTPQEAAAVRYAFFARYAGTRAEADDALTHKLVDGRAILRGLELLPLGRAYLLAGQVDAAIPYLRMAANSCSILPDASRIANPNTIWFLRANLLLGQALEQKGDTVGACAQYTKVLARWPHPIPRSVTVDAARAAVKKLKCAQ